MDSRTHLDCVLFQLTPTRTRCDLVICSGNTNEKLASGLLEPFVSHLKSAKDQISKGGYSINLRSDGSWFTKATLERFVKFVSTPEVLERFVTLETEIQQIEKSIQSNDVQNNDVATDPDGNSVPEENSKVRLHRVLETRRAVLRKEQAMAYARALVAGFDLEYLDDLISFANAFGALRLREACINFMELCKEKNEDRVWIDEIAAMEAYSRPDLPYLATSGIVLASDPHEHNHIDTSDGSLDAQATVESDAKSQVPYPWQNHLQQHYMNSFQGSMFPQMAPYPPPGYVFPGMQVPPSYYPNWPQTEDPGHAFSRDSDARSHKSKKKHRKACEKVEEDESSSTVSDSETDGEVEKMYRKKHGKKSSRKVVIRNINYITSTRDGERKTGSSEGSLSDEDGNREVGSFNNKGKNSGSNQSKKQESEKRHLKDEEDGWGAFESLLMREEEEPTPSVGVELHREDYTSSKSCEVGSTKQQLVVSDDSFAMIEKDMSSNPSPRFESENGGTIHPTQRKMTGPSFEDSLFLQKSGTDVSPTPDNGISIVSSSTRNVQRHGNWFIDDPLNKPRENLDLKVVENDSAFLGGSLGTERKMRDRVIDDSFMVEGRVTAEDHELGARSMADISMVSDTIEPTKKEISSFEPDELYMMLDRDNEVDHSAIAWTQEMISESNNTLLSEVNRMQSESETMIAADELPSKDTKVKVPGKEARSRTGSVGRNKPDLTSRAKIPTAGSRIPIHRSKNVKEEDNRKRMEELHIQRQRRIAERSANNGGNPGGTRKSTVETKVAKIQSETKKTTHQLKITETPKLRNPISTIDRLPAARVTTKKVPQTSSKMNGGSIQAPDSKKPSSRKTEASKKKNGVQRSSQAKTESRKLGGQEKETADVLVSCAESIEEQGNQNPQLSDDFKDIKVLESIAVEQEKKPPAPVVLKLPKSVQFKPEAEISFISSPGSDTANVREMTPHPEPSPPNLPLSSSAVHRIEVSRNNSTTPPEEQVMNSRKKWNSDEKLGKTTKRLQKLLLFGKKSLNSLRN